MYTDVGNTFDLVAYREINMDWDEGKKSTGMKVRNPHVSQESVLGQTLLNVLRT